MYGPIEDIHCHVRCGYIGLLNLDNPFTETNRAAFIINHLDIKTGIKIIDAGCGPGRLTIPAAKKVGPLAEYSL